VSDFYCFAGRKAMVIFMKAKIIETCRENGHALTDIGSSTFISEEDIRKNCTVEPTNQEMHPWDVEQCLINIHPDAEYQTIIGFGGAFTETSATAWNRLSQKSKDEFMTAYFDQKDGIGYNFGRCHIGSCDFALSDYSYVDEGDMTLSSFSIDHDRALIIPFIKAAMKKSGEMKLFASPWSPPKYMKTNNLLQGGSLKKDCYGLWAQYIRRFIDAYSANGIEFWGVTVQNEPRHNQIWESCVFTEEEERELVKNHLGPALDGTGVNILCYDHCKERLYERAKAMFTDPDAKKYCQGIAYHWYSGDHFGEMDMVSRRFPDKYIISSEGCMADEEEGIKTTNIWNFGENYAHELCGGLNNGLHGFTDWNIALDEHNGPFHNREGRRRFADAPIICDGENDRLIRQPSYYYIGHFSKYIQRGARRIGTSSYSQSLETAAFKNPDGSIACVILNRTAKQMKYILRIGNMTLERICEPHSIVTAIITD
jgi:glucosylceramidase